MSALRILAITVAPVFFVALVIYTRVTSMGPGFWSDPDWYYLFNGILYSLGRGIVLFEHPGVPVSMLVGILIQIKYALRFTGLSNLVVDVLNNSGSYYEFIGNGFLFINSAALLLFGWLSVRGRGHLFGVVFAQVALVTQSQFILFSGRPLPEGLYVAIGSLMGIWMARFFEPGRRDTPIVFGIFLGTIVCLKLIFLPFLLFLFLQRKMVSRWISLLVAVGIFWGFLGFLHTKSYDKVLTYFSRFFINKGRWGGGEAGFPGLRDLAENFTSLYQEEYLNAGFFCLFLAITLYLAVYLFLRRQQAWKPFAVSVMVLTFIFVATLKQPGAKYLLPGLALVPSVFLGLFRVPLPLLLRWGPVVLWVSLTLVWSPRLVANMENLRILRVTTESAQLFVTRTIRENAGCEVAVVPGLPFVESASFMGNALASNSFSSELHVLYPRHWLLSSISGDSSTNFLGFAGKSVAFDSFRSYLKMASCILFLGRKDIGQNDHPDKMLPEFIWTEMFHDRQFSLKLGKRH